MNQIKVRSFLVVGAILFFPLLASCASGPINKGAIELAVSNALFWKNPTIKGKTLSSIIARQSEIAVSVSVSKGAKVGFAQINFTNDTDSNLSIVLYLNGPNSQYQSTSDMISRFKGSRQNMTISSSEINIAKVIRTFKPINKRLKSEYRKLLESCFKGKEKKKVFWVGPWSPTCLYLTIYCETDNLIYERLLSPMMTQEAGPQSLEWVCLNGELPLGIKSPSREDRPIDANLSEWALTKQQLKKYGTKICF
jgi:hypothetical protein